MMWSESSSYLNDCKCELNLKCLYIHAEALKSSRLILLTKKKKMEKDILHNTIVVFLVFYYFFQKHVINEYLNLKCLYIHAEALTVALLHFSKKKQEKKKTILFGFNTQCHDTTLWCFLCFIIFFISMWLMNIIAILLILMSDLFCPLVDRHWYSFCFLINLLTWIIV